MLTDTQLKRYADVLLWGLTTARSKPFKKGDGDGEVGNVVGKVIGAIQGIDVPAILVLVEALPGTALLGYNPVVRVSLNDSTYDQILGHAIVLCDQVNAGRFSV